MLPWKEFREPIGLTFLLAGLVLVFLVASFQIGTIAPPAGTPRSPLVAGATSRSVSYPPVRITVPATSIFAPSSAY